MSIGSGIAITGACASIAATTIWGQPSISWMGMFVLAFVAGSIAVRQL